MFKEQRNKGEGALTHAHKVRHRRTQQDDPSKEEESEEEEEEKGTIE